jgi:rubrerythrin
MKEQPKSQLQTKALHTKNLSNSRRNFLKIGGMAAVGSSLFLYSCSDDDDAMVEQPPVSDVFDLGSGDVGILNYAYALEQLEAAFYTQVLDGSYWASASAEERLILEDLYKHEVIHRDFFKTALNSVASSNQVLPELQFNFDTVDFGSRSSVLGTAQVLEDTGVAAYNGAAKFIQEANYLVVAGKIVSVEARHASAIRSIFQDDDTAFAGPDIVDENGLDLAKSPSTILQEVGDTGFIETKFTANNLPTG